MADSYKRAVVFCMFSVIFFCVLVLVAVWFWPSKKLYRTCGGEIRPHSTFKRLWNSEPSVLSKKGVSYDIASEKKLWYYENKDQRFLKSLTGGRNERFTVYVYEPRNRSELAEANVYFENLEGVQIGSFNYTQSREFLSYLYRCYEIRCPFPKGCLILRISEMKLCADIKRRLTGVYINETRLDENFVSEMFELLLPVFYS